MSESDWREALDVVVRESFPALADRVGGVVTRSEVVDAFARRIRPASDPRKRRATRRLRAGQVSRRRFLSLLGLGTGAALLGAGSGQHLLGERIFGGRVTGAQAAGRFSFDEAATISASDGDDITGELRSAAEAGRLIRIPEGTYELSGEVKLPTRTGVIGEGQVRLELPAEFNEWAFHFDEDSRYGVVKNVVFDQRADGATTGINVTTDDGFHIENVEYLGRGLSNTGSEVNAIGSWVASADGAATVRNVVAAKGNARGAYKGAAGKMFSFHGPANKGAVTYIDCRAEEFGNNGIYAEASPGPIKVYGGEWWNNSPASLRFSGGGSLIKGALVGVSRERYTGPTVDDEGNTRGLWLGSKKAANCAPGYTVVEDCDFRFPSVRSSSAVIFVKQNGSGVKIRDCRIMNDDEGANHTILCTGQGQIDEGHGGYGCGGVVDPPHDIQIINTHITGSTEAPAVEIAERPGSFIQDCCIATAGPTHRGTVEVRGELSTSGCTPPNDAPQGGGPSDGGTDGQDGGAGTGHELVLSADGDGPQNFWVRVNGAVEHRGGPGAVVGATAVGSVDSDPARFHVSGEIAAVRGESVQVRWHGEQMPVQEFRQRVADGCAG